MTLIADLSALDSWEPSGVVIGPPELVWKHTAALRNLGDFCDFVKGRVLIAEGLKVTSGINIQESGIWKYRIGASETQGLSLNSRDGLSLGDLVLYPNRPVLRISSRASGVAFVGNFIALRPKSPKAGLVLWGLLNTSKGQEFLTRYLDSSRALVPRFGYGILEHKIPQYEFHNKEVHVKLEAFWSETEKYSGEGEASVEHKSSWCRVGDLPEGNDWSRAFINLDAFREVEGTKFADLIDRIEFGRDLVSVNETYADRVPAVGHKFITQGVRDWVSRAESNPLAAPGAVLLPRIGLKSSARRLDEPSVLGKGVVAVYLIDLSIKDCVVDFFNSPEGQAQREVLVKGAYQPYLVESAIREFILPHKITSPSPLPLKLTEALDGCFD